MNRYRWSGIGVTTRSEITDMNVKVVPLEGWRRDVEKNLSRDLDDHLLSNGHRSYSDLAISNDFFAELSLSGFAVTAVGGRRLSRSNG